MSNTETQTYEDPSAAPPPEGEPEDEINVEDMTDEELLAMSRNAEARAHFFSSVNRRSDGAHQEALDNAQSDWQKYANALRERNLDVTGQTIDPRKTVPDKEGTAPTLADATGTFAENAEVANIGGIGIKDSNANPEGALEKLKARARGSNASRWKRKRRRGPSNANHWSSYGFPRASRTSSS